VVKEKGRSLIAQNRKARHDYAILDTYEAGVALVGTEVKSLRLGRASLVEAYATVDDGKIREGGLTLVPLSLYFSDGKVKCELALARGKKSYDKRSDLAKRDADREIQRAYGRAAKGRAREMR
jgi:SsrA-binding protein